jgi:hypothetical protein
MLNQVSFSLMRLTVSVTTACDRGCPFRLHNLTRRSGSCTELQAGSSTFFASSYIIGLDGRYGWSR